MYIIFIVRPPPTRTPTSTHSRPPLFFGLFSTRFSDSFHHIFHPVFLPFLYTFVKFYLNSLKLTCVIKLYLKFNIQLHDNVPLINPVKLINIFTTERCWVVLLEGAGVKEGVGDAYEFLKLWRHFYIFLILQPKFTILLNKLRKLVNNILYRFLSVSNSNLN